MLYIIPSYFLNPHLPSRVLPAVSQNSSVSAVLEQYRRRRERYADKPDIQAGRLGKVICCRVLGTGKCQSHKGIVPGTAGGQESLGGRSAPSAAPPTPRGVGCN